MSWWGKNSSGVRNYDLFVQQKPRETISREDSLFLSNAESRRMDEVAPSLRLGPAFDLTPSKSPSEDYFETKAPPTPRRLKDESSKNLELTPVWQQIISYKKLPYNVNKVALFHEISQRLVDPEWQVRQHGLKVLQDVIPVVKPDEIDELMINYALSEVVLNLSHSAPAVKSSALDVLMIFIKYSRDPEYVLRAVIFQALESPNIPSNLQINAMNCLPTLLSQILTSEEFDATSHKPMFSHNDYGDSNTLKVDTAKPSSRGSTPSGRTPERARTPVSAFTSRINQLSHQSLVHLVTVLAKKMAQITFQHSAVTCMERIKHLIGAIPFDHFLESYKPSLKRDFDVLCQVYELPNSNISDVVISPMDSLISSEDKDGDVFLSDNERLDSTSSNTSFASSSDENPHPSQNNLAEVFYENNQNPIMSDDSQIRGKDETENETPVKERPVSNPDSTDLSTSSFGNGSENNISDQSAPDSSASKNESECINNSEILVETEIKLSEDTAIQMMVLQGKDDQKDKCESPEEDEDAKQLKRVTFGGEIVKLRTPDSDNQITDDDESKRSYKTIQTYEKDDANQSKNLDVTARPENSASLSERFVKLEIDKDEKSSSEINQKTDAPPVSKEKLEYQLPQIRSNFLTKNSEKQTELKTNTYVQSGSVLVSSREEGQTGVIKGSKLFRKTDQRVSKKSRRPRSSHIPIPIKPALHRPKYRRYILSANHRRSSSKSQISSTSTYDVRDSPIPNLEGGESLTSSSEGEARLRQTELNLEDIVPAKVGVISSDTLDNLNNKYDWRQRVRGLDQLTHNLRQPDVVRYLGTNDAQKAGGLALLRLLISILNERKAPLRVLTSCLKSLRALCLALPAQNLATQLPLLVPAICHHLGGGSTISVKLEAVETIKTLLRKLKPTPIVNVLFTEQCFFSKSSKMRESSLLCLLYALMTFPSTEFNIPGLINVLLKFGSHETKRRVRQALLDTYAVLGQFSPLPVSPVLKTDDKEMILFKKAVQMRLTRRQLPTVSPEGLISYALQVSSMSKGADVEWIRAGSGTVSVGSAESQSQFSVAPFLNSDQQHSFSSGLWGETVNEIIVTGVPPIGLRAREIPGYPSYTDNTRMREYNWNEDPSFFYAYGFPQLKSNGTDSKKVEDMYSKNTGAPSRGLQTWPTGQSNLKFSSSPQRTTSVDLAPDHSSNSYPPRVFNINNSSNLPTIASSQPSEWRAHHWADNLHYHNPKTANANRDVVNGNLSKWSRQDQSSHLQQYSRIDARGDSMADKTELPFRSGLNKFTATTSVHNRMAPSNVLQPNSFAPLQTHIVNLPDGDLDFSKNDDSLVNKNYFKSVPETKSPENFLHKNGYGDRSKFGASFQRKPFETNQTNASHLYPSTLQPFDSPKDALDKCLLQIESPEWEIVMQSLQAIVRLARHHPEVLSASLHRVVTGLAKQIRSLRSQVTKAACNVSQELFINFGKMMDPELDELAPALLSRTFDANKFLQNDANAALDSMVDNVSPGRSVTFLITKGAKHRNAVVRTTACRLLARLCQNLGVEQIFSLPKDTRDSILNAAAKFLLEGSLDTRAYAKQLFCVLAQEPKFMKIMNEVVPSKTMEAVKKPLIKIIGRK